MTTPEQRRQHHLVVVEAYHGHLEYFQDENEAAASQGLGLPLDELADALDCRITLLDWSEWQAFEQDGDSYARWIPYPATRPLDVPKSAPLVLFGDRIARRAIPARNPDHGRPFAAGLDPRTYGLLADSDPLLVASYVLDQYLEELWHGDPFELVIVTMFGGAGFVAQMARATGAGMMQPRFAAIATGSSAQRQVANGEGYWTRPAITRRQMEDMSLALADLAISFGPAGADLARSGRSGRIVEAPRRVSADLVTALKAAARPRGADCQASFFIDEPLQAASGTLLALDAAHALMLQDYPLKRPIACSGTVMRFAPALPKDFRSYWSSRGWAKALVERGYWTWSDAPPMADDAAWIRLFPSAFEHLPDVHSTLAAGQCALLSRNAAEGLAPLTSIPPALLLGEHPSADDLARRLIELEALPAAEIERLRMELCEAVLLSSGREALHRRLAPVVDALRDLLAGGIEGPSLDRAACRLLDARPGRAKSTADLPATVGAGPQTLTVAIPCFEMGRLIIETVESVWASTRVPDEVIIVDDGSRGEETAHALAELTAAARERSLPLTITRQSNQGLASARNHALAAASGTFISFIDGDDLIGREFYALALGTLVANPGLGGVAAWAETFGEGVPPGFWNAPQAELPLLLVENTVFVPCMSPVALLRDLGGYDVRQRYNYEDWELAIRIVASGRPIVTIPRYLQRYRVRADSLLRTMSDVQNQVMREELFRNHRATIETFGPELAAQIEHRLMLARERLSRPVALSGEAAIEALGQHARSGVRRSMNRAKWRLRTMLGAERGGSR